MPKPAAAEPKKKSYTAPALVVYGTIRDLTRKVGTSGNKDKVGRGGANRTQT